MKIKFAKLSVLLFFLVFAIITSSGCKVGYGCPNEDKPAMEFDDEGNIKKGKKRGKTHLFPKKMRRKRR